jgi:hypothetical protein
MALLTGDKLIVELEVIGVKGPRLYALCRGDVVGDRPSGRLGCRGDCVGDFRIELREVDDLDFGDLPGLTGVEAEGTVLEWIGNGLWSDLGDNRLPCLGKVIVSVSRILPLTGIAVLVPELTASVRLTIRC